jgi:hypothetical protein
MAQRMSEITDHIEAIDQTIASLTDLLGDLVAAAELVKAVNVVAEGLKSDSMHFGPNWPTSIRGLPTHSRSRVTGSGGWRYG